MKKQKQAVLVTAQDWAKAISQRWQGTVEAIIDTGRLLIEAKAALPGEFAGMFKQDFHSKVQDGQVSFVQNTGEILMVIARNPVLTNSDHGQSLPASWRTLYELSKLPEADLEAAIADGKIWSDMTRKDVAKLRLQRVRAIRATVPAGKFSCIVIDPPWPMEKIERDERPNQFGFDYPTMTEEELMDPERCPVIPLSAEDCHLYLWTTHKYLPMAIRLAEHWGFSYQCVMTWVKNVGFTPFSWMYSTEHVLFCRKGSLQLEKLGMRLDFAAKVREHSRKPDEFYELVRQASPGPRIDMFSREEREGFATWGNESDKFAAA